MEKEKFKVLLYLKKGAKNKSGLTPIMGRITIQHPKNGNSMAQFSTKLSCKESLWNARESRLNGKSKIAVETNSKINKLLLAISEAYENLQKRNKPFTAKDVKNLVQGGVASQMMLMRLLDIVTKEVEARVGVDRSHRTPPTYYATRRCLMRFVKHKFKCDDIALGQLNEQFIREFQDFALIKEKYALDTVRHYLAILKKVCKVAFREGHCDRHYFAYYPLPKQKLTPPRALSREDFEAIRDLEILPQKQRHRQVRDMFLFSCYVGSSFVDTVAITKDNLSVDDAGNKWLKYHRSKNRSLSRVRLLPEAVEIIELYYDDFRDTIFPEVKYEQAKYIIRSIGAIVGVQGGLSYHQGRHTFSSLITLEQGVSIEAVSKMLGHSDIRTTQIYARVTPAKLFEDMDRYIKATTHLKLTL